MQEHVIMEIVGIFTGLLIVLMIAAASLFFFQVQEANSFRQTINYHIEREGGLTPEAMTQLETHSERFYNGRFTISSPQSNQRVNFGEKVEYTIHGSFPIAFLPIPNMRMDFNGVGVSHVR